jgi:hypothetical protein
LVRRLRRIDAYAATPVVLISAQGENADMCDLDGDPHLVVLPKPWAIRDLVQAASDLLVKPAAAV